MIQLYKVKKIDCEGKILLSLKNDMVLTDTKGKKGIIINDAINEKFNIQLFGEEPVPPTAEEEAAAALDNILTSLDVVELVEDFNSKIIESVAESMDKVDTTIKPYESELFDVQLEESKAYIADKTAIVPTITLIAKTRGITILQLAKKVIDAAKTKQDAAAVKIGKKYAAKDKAVLVLQEIETLRLQFIEAKDYSELTENQITEYKTRINKMIQKITLENFDLFLSEKTVEEIVIWFVNAKDEFFAID